MWTQVYDPMNNMVLSTLVALIPIIFFFIALTVLKLKGYVAGTITVLLALLVAIFAYQMPLGMALSATVYGFGYGLWPIAWIIVTAVFLYEITVKTGQFDIIRASIINITEDQRLQLLLVGFCFGAFLEGAAGFGAPVAITAALLVGLGFNPLYAAGLCLIANTAPVAFGAMGIPFTVAGQVTGIPAFEIGQMAGRQLPLLSIIVPFWLIAIMDGWKGVKETWPAILVCGGSFGLAVFVTANFISHELPDITASIISLVSLALFLKVWKPKTIFRFDHKNTIQQKRDANAYVAATAIPQSYSFGTILKAWSPFILLTAVVSLWSSQGVKDILNTATVKLNVPGLHELVVKVVPVVPENTPYAAQYVFNIFSATGTAILLTAILTKFITGMKTKDMVATFGETVKKLAWPIYTIGMVLGFAFIANYSGLSSTLGLTLANTGSMFPFFSPFLGWLGVFLTGSDTSANALFAALQQVTASQLNLSETLMVAANSTGGVTGKMISPQSIAVACAAVGLIGKESDLFRFTVKHSIIFAVIIGIITSLQTYVFPWMIP